MEPETLVNQKIAQKHPEQLFEQYKMHVESAQEISRRRDSANQFYLAINTAIVSISGYLNIIRQENLVSTAIPLFGLIISWYWRQVIKSYCNINTGKFEIIQELEEYLPAKTYKKEWVTIGKGKTGKYRPVTDLETKIPIAFMLLYLAILIAANWATITKIIG